MTFPPNSRHEGDATIRSRYCSHHRAYGPVEGGAWRTYRAHRGKASRRWICAVCLARIAAGRGKTYNREIAAKERAAP